MVSKSLQMINCEVLFPDCQEWFVVSIVYAANEEPPRRDLWSELVSLSTSPAVKDKAWIVMGDFNQTLDPSEHSHPPSLNVDRHMRDFRDCLAAAELSDMVLRGNTFTWWNKSKTRPVAKKLDRILVNDNWPILFPASHSFFGEPDFSDHASCGVVLDTQKLRVRSPFKFYNFLLLNPDFLTLIEYHWFSLNVSGSAMYRLSKKLKSLKFIIREFNKDNFSNLEKRVKEAHEVLLKHQARTLANPSGVNASRELEAERKWQILVRAEEAFFYQKSRITWLSDGDGNTSFFHRSASTRQAINHIHFIQNEDNSRIESQQGIKDHCLDYFAGLLGGETTSSQIEQSDMDLLIPFRCQDSQKVWLEKDFSSVEIKEAFFSLPRNKTSGPMATRQNSSLVVGVL